MIAILPRHLSVATVRALALAVCTSLIVAACVIAAAAGQERYETLASGLDREAVVACPKAGRVDLHAVGQPLARERQP